MIAPRTDTILGSLLLALALSSCGTHVDALPGNSQTTVKTAAIEAPADNLSTSAQTLLTAVNTARGAHGLHPVRWSAKLAAAAQRHADDLHLHELAGHTGSDGSTAPQRVSDAGYIWQSTSENVASGAAHPQAAVTLWLNEAGPRANILSAIDTQMGAAQSGSVWVLLFAKPLDGDG